MPEKNLLEQKKSNLMKALNRQGADYIPTMLASSCAEVAWTGQKVTDVIGDANAYDIVSRFNAVGKGAAVVFDGRHGSLWKNPAGQLFKKIISR